MKKQMSVESIRVGQICNLRQRPDRFGLYHAPPVLVLSGPQEMPSGEMAVTVVPLYTGGPPQMTDTDLALFYPFVEMGWEPVTCMFSCLQSILCQDLYRPISAVSDDTKPLLSAMWKYVCGLGPQLDWSSSEVEPKLAWDLGWPIPLGKDGLPNQRDVRLMRLYMMRYRMKRFGSNFHCELIR